MTLTKDFLSNGEFFLKKTKKHVGMAVASAKVLLLTSVPSRQLTGGSWRKPFLLVSHCLQICAKVAV